MSTESFEMRLTRRLPDNLGAVPVDGYGWPEIADKLSAYEDTGLTPEEIDEFARQACVIRTAAGCKTLEDCYKLMHDGRLVCLPCKVGDTVWFVVKEKLPVLGPGTYHGTVTEIKAVQRKSGTLFLAIVEYEYLDPWFNDGRFSKSEMHCSYTEYGSWVRFFTQPPKAESALEGGG